MAEGRTAEIPGYGYGAPDTARSPLGVGDFDLLKESEDEGRQVANLARLGLTNDEVKKMSEELGVILESVEQIGELDLSGMPPTANPLNSTNVLRPDEPDVPLQCLPREEILSPAPEPVHGLFVVSRIE